MQDVENTVVAQAGIIGDETATQQLTFNQTLSIAKFKEMKGVNSLSIIKNPHTSRLFFVSRQDSTVSGAVSSNYNSGASKSISEVTTPDGETFWLIHKGSNNEDNLIETL